MIVAPVRTCVGCRRRAPKALLVRFASLRGTLTLDPAGLLPGRGAYTCPNAACFERAAGRRAFTRTLRQAVEIPPGISPEG
ncbi:MAG: YlxR family protein [Thermoleophilia bacterium]|nr:YlxR family protein [Thermoleophilia bacterium]